MKKKTIALAVVVVLVLGAVAGTLIGCDLITTNAEKDYNQVVATVNYGGLTDYVLKGELRNLYSSYGPVYVQYYGMTEQEALEYLYDSLARQSLLQLKAEAEVAKHMGVTFTNDSALTELLTYDEQRYCIQRANAEFKSLWETNIEEREKEQAANDNEEEQAPAEEEEQEELEARPVREEQTPSTDYVADPSFTAESGKLPVQFNAWYNEQMKQVQDEIDDLNSQIAAAGGADTAELEGKLEEARTRRSNMRSAYNDLQKTLEENHIDYQYYLENQYESRISAKYEELVGAALTVSDEECAAYITKQEQLNVESFTDEEAYASSLESGGTVVKHYEKGYFNVRSILLGFSEEQQTYLSALTTRLGDEDVADFRAVLALGIDNIDERYTGLDADNGVLQEIAARWGKTGLGINISDTEYDSVTDKLSEAYTARNVNYADVLAAMVKYIADYKADFLAAAKQLMGEDYSGNEEALEQYAINEAFTDLMYLVNDDSGMFESTSYQVTPDGTATSYVEEYAVLARRLYKETPYSQRADVGTMAITEANRGGAAMISGSTSDTSFNNEKFAEAPGTEYQIFVAQMSSEINDGRKIEAPVYTFVTADGSISFIINTYGIQIVMINGYAFDEAQIGSTVTEQAEGDHTWYVLRNEYPYQVNVNVVYELDDDFTYVLDDNGNKVISSIEVERKTLKEYVNDLLLEGKKTDNYNTVINKFVSENEDSCVMQDAKVYQQLIDELISE